MRNQENRLRSKGRVADHPSTSLRFLFILAAFLGTLAGCASPVKTYLVGEGRAGSEKAARIVLMEADIMLFEITAGGLKEPKAGWTEVAEEYFCAGLRRFLAERNHTPVPYRLPEGDPEAMHAHHRILQLHRAVQSTIFTFKYGTEKLPTKAGRFDWSLGPEVSVLRRQFDADYALFVILRDSTASSGRLAMGLAFAYFGATVPMGQQLGIASLVDLNDGRIVWFNRLARSAGNLLNIDDAYETVKLLMAGAPL